MSFISLPFAIFFLLFASAYHFVGRFLKNGLFAQRIVLFAASLLFYAWADLRFVPFLAYVIAVSYFGALLLCIGGGYRRFVFFALVIADVAPLLFFKYAPSDWHSHIIFPLGLSFFTFQSVSYIADCYLKKIEAEKNFLNVALFVSFFPVVSSGPIQRASSLIPQFNKVHRYEYESATDGLKLFAWGIFKKLCLADRLALYINQVYANPSDSYGCALLFATVLYSFQIYLDFSGYSDMAIGVAKYCGFDVGKNFEYPYLSKSVGEFWRRWHISLSTWLRDYIYIPLGGSRVALLRIYLNLVITFLVSGIWHGAGARFIVWGLLHGLYQCAGRALKPALEKIKIPDVIKIIVTFCLVTFAWIFFRAQSLHAACVVIQKITLVPQEIANLMAADGAGVSIKDSVKTLLCLTESSYGYLTGMALNVALLAAFLVCELVGKNRGGLLFVKSKPIVVRFVLYITLTLFIFFNLVKSSNTEFLYFAF